ncbi:carboxypeptidase-like regulatory domain-containing protein [Allomeiothermus silvanus]|uniref:carboxypeptidase-like regulatory domain-containing protein n=1 Tax=Allomeiothermus silvanus TaxID=52022 RepID=UPI0011D0E432|nr:carboxypeptidase-like regulatory domain-containing protein [Allomeiothermus silvanus]
MYQSISTGGSPVAGARVQLQVGGSTQSAFTDSSGAFALTYSGTANFSLTVIPPAGSGLGSVTYDGVAVAAYKDQYGAAGEMNIYLPGGRSTTLPGTRNTFGCITGRLLDTDGTTPVVANPPAQAPNRTSPAACNGTQPPGLFNSGSTAINPGENGLVLFGGFRVVTTQAGGSFRVPLFTGNNGFAFSGSLWGGNYTGTDTGDPNTATAYFWEKFAFKPRADLYTKPSNFIDTPAGDLVLEPFDPASNPKVTTLPITHDTSALSGFDFSDPNEALLYSIPLFNHAIHSSGIELGQYYNVGASGAMNMRVIQLDPAAKSQQIEVNSTAFNLDTGASSTVTQWRDGTNLSTPLTAKFLAIPSLQAPANNASGQPRSPTLSWNAVPGATLYEVDIYDANGKLVWYGLSKNTSLSVPITLEANKAYLWQAFAYEGLEMSDAIGRDPDATLAARWINPRHLAGLKGFPSNPVNEAYGRMAQAYLDTLGYIPAARPTSQRYLQNLLTNGYRESASEVFAFQTGN